MATFDRLANLPLTIEGYELEGKEFTTTGFERLSTVIQIKGEGEEGVGEDVTYDPVDHVALQDAGTPLDLTGHATLGEFCAFMAGVDTFPDDAPAGRLPPLPALGLRVGGARPGAAPGWDRDRRGARPRGAAGDLRQLDAALSG